VVFTSGATNLVVSDTHGSDDAFVRVSGTTTRVSVSSSGQQANDFSGYFSSISADGRYVAFNSSATNLVPGDTNDAFDVFVRDRVSGTTTRVSVSSSGQQGNTESRYPSISADGRHLMFRSGASNLVSGDTNGVRDVFVRDRVSGSTIRASVSSSGQQGNSDSFGGSISADGRHVAFYSDASNLVPGDTNSRYDVFVRDLGGPVVSDGLFASLRGATEVPGPRSAPRPPRTSTTAASAPPARSWSTSPPSSPASRSA